MRTKFFLVLLLFVVIGGSVAIAQWTGSATCGSTLLKLLQGGGLVSCTHP